MQFSFLSHSHFNYSKLIKKLHLYINATFSLKLLSQFIKSNYNHVNTAILAMSVWRVAPPTFIIDDVGGGLEMLYEK